MKHNGSVDDDSSTSLDAEFMQGLREMGLLQDEAAPKSPSPPSPPSQKTSPKKSPSPLKPVSPLPAPEPNPSPAKRPTSRKRRRAAQQPPAPKRRPSSRAQKQRLALFELLSDDAERDTPSGPSVSDIELRLSEYLDASIRQMLDSFAREVSAMLHREERVDAIVSEFVRDLRDTVKQTVAFESGPIAVPIFEAVQTETAEFRNVMAAADRLRPRERTAPEEALMVARTSITAESSSLQSALGSLVDELRDELADLHRLRTNMRRKRRDSEKRASAIARGLSELEAEEIVHRAEVELFEKGRRRIENGRKYPGESVELRVELRDVCDYMRRLRHRVMNPFAFLKRKSLEIVEQTQEVQSMRSAYEMAQSNFYHALESLSFSLNGSKLVRSMPTLTRDDEFTRTEVSMSEVRRKFDRLQEQRDRTLENWSVFLDDLARKHRVGSPRRYTPWS